MKLFRFYLPPILWMLVIFLFSSRQRLHVSDVLFIQFAFFKTLHIVEYGFLYVLWYRALYNTTSISKKYLHAICMIITIVYAISDEIHQTFVPTREGKLRDVLFDAFGAILALVSIWKLLPKAPKKLKNWAKSMQLI